MPAFVDMEIELLRATAPDKPLLQRLMQFYLYDFTEFLNLEMDAHGVFEKGILDSYFPGDETKTPYLIKVNAKPAGFILISEQVMLPENTGAKCIKEFFVLKRYRRAGVGKNALATLLAAISSKWEVRVIERNQPAIHFWEAALRWHGAGKFSRKNLDNEQWKGPVFSFESIA